MTSMNYFDADMSKSTNTVVHIAEKGGKLYLHLLARWHTIYAEQEDCSIFHPAKFEQRITHQHVLLRRESLIGGTAITKKLCLYILSTHRICINFKTLTTINNFTRQLLTFPLKF